MNPETVNLENLANAEAFDAYRKSLFQHIQPGSFVPFAFHVPILGKGVGIAQGTGTQNWFVNGPLSEPGEDLEGEEMDMSGLKKGLKTFFELHAPVDWDHLWEKTREPKWLIGRGVSIADGPHPVTGVIVPFLRSEIFREKEMARQAIDHFEKGGSLGYSVAGGVVKKEGNKILEPIVTSVALTPVPVVSKNTGCVQMVKSLMALQRGEVNELPVAPELLWSMIPYHLQSAYKALMASASLPHSGPGISALMVEDLGEEEEDEKRREEERKKGLAKAINLFIAARLTTLRSA